MSRFKVKTTLKELEALFEAAHGRGNEVKIPRTGLMHLLMDHVKMADRLAYHGEPVESPTRAGVRIKS